MFKKALAFILAALLSIQPAGAAENFAASLKSMLLQSVAEGLASGLDVARGDPALERSMTANIKTQARTAAELFSSAAQPNAKLYDPGDPITSKAQLERWRAFSARTTNKKALNEGEIQEAADALLPFCSITSRVMLGSPLFLGIR